MSDDVIEGKDGHQYVILATEKENNDLPTLNRYKVRRDDGAIIDNFPGYLLRTVK